MALTTLVVYLVAGAVVASIIATRLSGAAAMRAARFLLHLILWPLFVPLLMPVAPPRLQSSFGSAYAERIERGERSLEEALGLLGGELNDQLPVERARVAALGRAMRVAAARLEELDGLVKAPGNDDEALQADLARLKLDPEASALVDIVSQRLGHVARLKALRRQAQADLERAIARSGELATRLTLLRYEDPSRAGIAAAKARELTDSIEDLCSVLTEVRTAEA
jgi:hypothetical protein